MPWKRVPNDLRGRLTGRWPDSQDRTKVQPNFSPEQARLFALKDPSINCFCMCLPYNMQTQKYQPNSAVFFSLDEGTLEFLLTGSHSQQQSTNQTGQDLYVKAGMTVAYYNPNMTQPRPLPFASVGTCTTAGGQYPAVDVVCIFAANLVRGDPRRFNMEELAPSTLQKGKTERKTKNPSVLAANHDVLRLLKTEQETIEALHKKGISVLLSVLNHHSPAAWSEFTPEENEDASLLAKQVKKVVEEYHLDGVDIDDEYSHHQDNVKNARWKGTPLPVDKSVANSLSMLTAKLGYEFRKEKIVSKTLFEDQQYFGREYRGLQGKTFKLEEELTYGYEMTYWEGPEQVLPRYVAKGVAKWKLLKGFKPSQNPQRPLDADLQWMKEQGYAGFMLFEFERREGQELMVQLANKWLEN